VRPGRGGRERVPGACSLEEGISGNSLSWGGSARCSCLIATAACWACSLHAGAALPLRCRRRCDAALFRKQEQAKRHATARTGLQHRLLPGYESRHSVRHSSPCNRVASSSFFLFFFPLQSRCAYTRFDHVIYYFLIPNQAQNSCFDPRSGARAALPPPARHHSGGKHPTPYRSFQAVFCLHTVHSELLSPLHDVRHAPQQRRAKGLSPRGRVRITGSSPGYSQAH